MNMSIEQRYHSGDVTGWRPDPAFAQKIFAANRLPNVKTATATIAKHIELRDVCLWRYLRQAFSETIKIEYRPQFQKNGTCVGQDLAVCCDVIMAVQHVTQGITFPGRAAVAGTYAGGRVDAANQPGWWEGSNNSWVVEWLTKIGGVLLKKDIGLPEDALDQDEQLAMRWTATREGVPRDRETLAKQRPVKGYSLCESAEDCAVAINLGAAICTASNLIPTGQRDSKGISKCRRSGGHSVMVDGFRLEDFSFWYQNSWNGWSGGAPWAPDEPEGGCGISRQDLDDICAQGDTYAIWGVEDPEEAYENFHIRV